jgi:oxepin-CoA hydrolase/3-oxo-5,6-dehydrosuberyl-CoA semialdehyde dehydrogenase
MRKPIDFAEAVHHARKSACRGCWRWTSSSAPRGSRRWPSTSERKEQLYAVSAHTGATRADSWIDIEGGTGTLFAYASIGSNELPQRQPGARRARCCRWARRAASPAPTSWCRAAGVAVHINAFNFPDLGLLEKLAPSFLAGMPCIGKPATATSYLTEALVRLIDESASCPRAACSW